MSKQKGPASVRSRGIVKEKMVPVAEGSLQPRAPGWVAPGSANVQSANVEQLGAALRARGSLQGGPVTEQNLGSQRGGSAQQAGWSARQSGQRMQARGEEERLNASRQSGDGGLEPSRQAGSQAESTGPAGSMQRAAAAGAHPGDPGAPPTTARATRTRKKSSRTK